MTTATTTLSVDRDEWELPKVYMTFDLDSDSHLLPPEEPDTQEDEELETTMPIPEFYDVRFYPYLDPEEDPVFAAVSLKHVVICKLSQSTEPACQFLKIIRAADGNNWVLTWAKTRDHVPLICVAGLDRKIIVYDAIKGTCYDTLVGHGEGIYDIKTSPADPEVIATASQDCTVRVWSLKPEHKAQPCMYILGGDAHQDDLLTVAFHGSGKYILSSGNDQIVNLWSLSEEYPKVATSTTPPNRLIRPHFSTSEVHSSLVDCIDFWGDILISRASHENRILLWTITGFSSNDPPPPSSAAPSNHHSSHSPSLSPGLFTRSAFAETSPTNPFLFQRLLELETAPPRGEELTWLHFDMFAAPGKHPVLAWGDMEGGMFFWDFERLMDFHRFAVGVKTAEDEEAGGEDDEADIPDDWKYSYDEKEEAEKPVVKPPAWLSSSRPGNQTTSAGVSGARAAAGGSQQLVAERCYSNDMMEAWSKRYSMGDSMKALKPHFKQKLPKGPPGVQFIARRTSWSPGGEWCVVAGSMNRCVILRRWAE